MHPASRRSRRCERASVGRSAPKRRRDVVERLPALEPGRWRTRWAGAPASRGCRAPPARGGSRALWRPWTRWRRGHPKSSEKASYRARTPALPAAPVTTSLAMPSFLRASLRAEGVWDDSRNRARPECFVDAAEGDHPEVVRGDDSEGGGGGWLLVRREAIGPRSQARGRQAERRLKMPTDSGMSFPVTSGVVSSDTDSRSLATFLSLYR